MHTRMIMTRHPIPYILKGICLILISGLPPVTTTYGQNYSISQTGTYSIEIDNPTYITVFEDDATEIPIGFDFEFFGTSYTHCWVGSDGFISFGADPNGGCCGQDIPDNNAPNNLIAVAWTNMDWNSVHYEVFGTTPDRRLVITLDYRTPCDSVYYGQVKLYESTHVIEIHTQEWRNGPCQGWNSTQGLENNNGTTAFPVPGRNYNDTWEVNVGDNDVVTFTPELEFIYIVEEDDADFSLEFGVPNDITIFEDDYEEVTLDFPFEFFGNTYNSVFIGFDGYIGFTEGTMGCCPDQTIPSSFNPNNLIAACWTDVAANYSNGLGNYNVYSYGTVGSFPERVFYVNFSFDETCYNTYYYGQIKLFESDFSIEIHTDYWAEYNSPCVNTTQGIENGTGTSAFFLEGRNNNTSWSVPCCGDMVRFIPTSSLPQNDAGVSHIFNDPFCEGSQLMSVLLRNFGGGPIDSVEIHWTWDGVPQDSVLYPFPLPVGNEHYYGTLAPQTLSYGETYELKAWTSMPNGMPDDNPVNDTMTATIKVGMDGTFTIGGTNPDFATIQEAIDSLTTIGVCDTVTMLIRPGTYTGHWRIPGIPGAFGKGVTFRAENGDSSSVILQYEATEEDSNYVIMFDNSFDVTIEKVTINPLGNNYATAIELRNFSYRNTIRHCAINGKNTSSTFRDYACIFSRAKNPLNTYAYNTIRYGSFGIYHEIVPPGIIIGLQDPATGGRGGGSGNPEDLTEENKIIGNTFLDFSRSAIRTFETKGLQIHGNHMESSQFNVRAMQLTDEYDTLSISNNTVYLPNGEYALHLTTLDPPDGARATIYNNMFNVPSSSISASAVGLFNCSDLNFYHNTVRSNSGYPLTYTIHHSGGTLDSFYNNIFVNTHIGPVIYLGSNNQLYLDYNVYRTDGTILGSLGGTNNNASNIEAWQSLTGDDAHSLTYDPMFVSDSNLHVTSSLINGTGSLLLTTMSDIDAEPRSGTAPDPGADEFTPGPHDAAITGILSPLPLCDPEQDIRLVLANLGTDSLHSVMVGWSVNGIPQTPVSYSPNASPEGDTLHVTLAQYIFGDQPDTLRFWTFMPNDSMDVQPGNDTFELIFRLPLQGTYTIGGTSPDFTHVQAAADAMASFRICGPVVFRIRDGVYTGQMVLDSIQGSSAINTITFESESLDSTAVTLQYLASSAATNYIVLLNGTDYITFRHLGFKPLNNLYANCLEAKNGVTHLTLENNYFNNNTSSTSNAIGLKAFAFGINEHFTVRHNYFKNGSHAIQFFNGGASLATYSDSMRFELNTFENQRFRAIDLQNTRNLTIRHNTITSNSPASYTAIDIDGTYLLTEIASNSISTGNAGTGMFINRVNFQNDPGTALIFNNMIHSGGSGLGIGVWNCSRPQVSFNSVNVTGSGHAFEISGGDSAVVYNNIFVANTGRAFTSFSTSPDVISNYNDLYNQSGDLGYWNSTAYADLAAWQAGTGFDTSSMSVDPEFVSVTDLHVLADTLDGAGIPVAGINLDFDGNPRNAMHPDIGADEIGANDDDAGVLAILPEMPFARGPRNVMAIVRNYGGNTLDSVTVMWTLNNVPQPAVIFHDDITTLQEDTVILSQVDFLLSIPYTIKAWTHAPNGQTDLYNSNDTLATNALYAAVSDTVTIGGISPDLTTISGAITALTFGGVLDSVHFQLRNGTYHETISIPQTMGMNCGTPIVFESESGNAADVIWDNLGLGANTLYLNGADGLQFKNLTIKTVLSAYHAVEFQNGANCNTFEGCVIEGVNTTSTSLAQATVYSNGTVNHNNLFKQNTIRNGSYALYWQGNGTSTGSRAENNHFENAYYMGLQMARQQAPVVRGNTVTTTSTHNYVYGLYFYECYKDAVAEGNQVLMPGKRGAGMTFYGCSGNSSQRSLIANNFILLGESNNSYGLVHQYSTYSDILHNTVRITGGAANGIAFYKPYATHLNVKNNIFQHESGGYAMYLSGNEGPFSSDFNDLITNGSHLVHHHGTNYADLLLWQAAGYDSNSISEEPMYTTPSGFNVTNAALNAVAAPQDLVPFDIEGQVRDTLTPDIGCDEFDLFNDDVGILSINYPTMPFPSGINTVFIKFSNNGQDTLTSMQVDWEVDDIPQPTYYWTGLLPSAATYDSLDIGEFNFSPYQYHSIKVWVSQPNGMADELASNDTLTVDSLYPALQGIYTIGGADPDFESLTIAADHLNTGGASGPVTFQIRSGTYLETLNFTDYPGSDCTRPVIFQSESEDSTDVIITNLGLDDNIITLDGADGMIFRHLTLQSVNPAFRNVVAYENGAHCNAFSHNEIIGYEGASTNTADAVIRSTTSLDTANVFAYNRIRNGSYGFYLLGGGSGPSNTRIEYNLLDQPYYFGVYAYQEYGISVLGNQIEMDDFTSARGIELNTCHGAIRVSRNKIRTPLGVYGIVLFSSHGTMSSPGITSNNFISVGGSGTAYGVYAHDCQHQQLYFNNIHIHSTTNNPGVTASAYLTNNTNIILRNNILSSISPGLCLYSSGNTLLSSDYNDFYYTGATLGFHNGVNYTDLSSWQSGTLLDSSSLDVNPQFMSNTDLHVSNILLNGSGLTIASLTSDIDGDIRQSPPDIGADEFDPSIPNDAGVFMYLGPQAPFVHGNQPVEIALKNYGSDTLTSVNIRWLVNGIEQSVHAWTGMLPPAQCDTLIIGSYSFAEYSEHDLLFWTEMPNAIPDSTHVNDTLDVHDVYPALSGTYTVGGVLPDFNLFSQVENALNKGGILGNVTFSIRNGTYSTQFAVLDFPRSSSSHTVTFRGEAGDSSLVNIRKDFNQPSKNYTVRLSNAHRIHFEDLTLSSTQGRVMDIANGSSHIEIRHCRLTSIPLNYSTGQHQVIYSHTTSEDSVYIHHNRIEYGDYGIFLTGSAGDLESGVVISHNEFHNCFYRSIHLYYQTGVTIDYNAVLNTNNVHEGMALVVCTQTKSIAGNDIRLLAGGQYGILLQSVSGTVSMPSRIYNNYILIRNGSGTFYGIYHSYGNYNAFDYNTVRMDSGYGSTSAFMDDSPSQHIHIRNCNFAHYAGGYAMFNYWATGFTTNTTNFTNLYSTGPVLAYYNASYATLGALQSGTGQNMNGMSAEPLFSDDNPRIFQAALDGTGTPIAGITTDIEGEARNATNPDVGADEFILPAHDIGAKLLVSPATYCGLSAMEEVTIRVQNYGANTETGFDVAYSLDGAAWVVENVGSLQVSPGGVLDYTFTTTEDLSAVGTYSFSIRTALPTDLNLSNDSLPDIETEHIPALTMPVSNMVPTQGETDLDPTVSFSWIPAPNATVYDVYIWEDGGTQPATPQISNIAQINTSYSNLNYGATYHWRVVAKNVCDQMVNSPIQQFSIRELPDLVIDTVIAPPTAFSGELVQIEWQTRNQGPGASQSQVWSDAVFLSQDATLNTSFDTYLGAVQNLTALDSNEAYTQTGLFMIPNGYTGNVYVFVYADRWNNLIETSNNNNWDRTPSPVMISLSPSADLMVPNVVAPSTTFSGQTISVTATIKNIGTAETPVATWHDRVYFGSDPLNYAGGQHIATIVRNGVLDVDSTYNLQFTVPIPEGISGDRFVYVVSDFNNAVFENAAESNNVGISDTIQVILTPPADLFAFDFLYPDTVHNNQLVTFNYTLENQGGSTIQTTSWYDQLFISKAPVYNTNFLTQAGTMTQYGPMIPFNPISTSRTYTVPLQATGVHYYYLSLDKGFNVFEHTFESNNIIRSATSFIILNPDLKSTQISHPLSGTAGQWVPVEWKTANLGPGDVYNRYWQTKIYISSDSVWNLQGSTLLQTVNLNTAFLAHGDTLAHISQVELPDGLSGPHFFHVFTDAVSSIFENGEESNNVGTSATAIHVSLPPYPDLTSREIIVPDTLQAGDLFTLQYEAVNLGLAQAPVTSTDSFFLSFSPTWNPATHIPLGKFTGVSALLPQDSQEISVVLPISSLQTSNVYYVYIKSDATHKVYEYVQESNNIQRSDPLFVLPAPPVDLRLDTVICPSSTVTSGQPVNISWTVKNISETTSILTGWQDALYLSVDSLLDTDIDIRFYEAPSPQGGLAPNGSYQRNVSPILPNGLSGDYFLIAVADDFNANQDEVLSNNINTIRTGAMAAPIHIDLAPSTDLTPQLFSAPSAANAGQPFLIIWSVINQGDATAQSWTDKIYLSSDNVINPGDVLLTQKLRTNANLAPLQIRQDTAEVFVPIQFQGNYFLLLLTDADQQIYEHLGESNNQLSRTIQFTPAPPSDLEITSIVLPDSTFAGGTVSVSWSTRNTGTHPAHGQLREIVYLSGDTTLDVDDQVFGLEDVSLYIPPGTSIPRNLTADVIGVTQGPYFALIQTDARDNISESNDDNNIGASIETMYVSLEELFLDSLTQDSFYNTQQHFFKLNIPGSQAGQNLRITLDGDVQGQYTEMYIKYGAAPTLSDFDYKHLYPFQQDQDLLVEGVQGGTYYLMFRGHTFHAAGQTVTILARIVDFELLSISPDKGVNRGQTTIELLGTHMDTLQKVYLLRKPEFIVSAVHDDTAYPLVYVPGSHQGWNPADSSSALANSGMSNVYEAYLFLPDSLNRLLFATGPDWDEYYGDNGANGSLELNGDTIYVVTQGHYFIQVNLSTLAYTISKVNWSIQGTALAEDGDLGQGLVFDSNIDAWWTETQLSSGSFRFKSLDETPLIYGDNGGDAVLEVNGSGINITESGLYTIRFYLSRGVPTYEIEHASSLRITADSIYEINSFRAFATFTLEGARAGLYTVQAIRWDGMTAELVDAFEILEEGEEPDLQLLMDYPGVVGAGNGPMKITIYMYNAGDRDIKDMAFRFEAPWGNLLATSYENLISGNTQVYLDIPAEGAFGPPGILPPKASKVVEVFAWSRPHPTFTLAPIDNE